jgi:hypothetical protein
MKLWSIVVTDSGVPAPRYLPPNNAIRGSVLQGSFRGPAGLIIIQPVPANQPLQMNEQQASDDEQQQMAT